MIKTKQFRKILLLVLIGFSLGCTGAKSAMSPTGKVSKYIEEFFVGEGVMQYFIQPLSYEGLNQKKITLDATLRNKDKKSDSLTVNFLVNLKSKDYVKNVNLSYLKSEDIYIIDKVKTFYFEPLDDVFYQHRVSIKVPYNVYADYLLDPNHNIIISNIKEEVVITPTSKAKKAINVLSHKLDSKIK